MLSTNFKKVMHTFQVMFLLRKAPLCGSLELKNVSKIMRTFFFLGKNSLVWSLTLEKWQESNTWVTNPSAGQYFQIMIIGPQGKQIVCGLLQALVQKYDWG